MTRPVTLVAYRAFSDVLGKGAFLVVTIAAARWLSGEAFGLFSLGSTIGWLATVAADFGIQLHLARSVAQHRDAAGPLLRDWLRVRLFTTVAALAAVWACLAATGLGGADTAALVLLSGVYAVHGLVEFLNYFYRGLSRSDLESTLTLGQRGATMVIAVFALWWRPSLVVLSLALLVPAAVTFACSAWLALRLARQTVNEPARPPLPMSTMALEFRQDVMPIGMGIVLSALYFRIDVLLIDWWVGATAVGLYSAVFRLVEALRLFPAAALAVALPALCRATSTRPLLSVAAAVGGFAVVATALLWVSAGWFVPLLYGTAYRDAVPAFQILVLAFPLMSLNYALTHQLIGWSGHRGYALTCLAALVCNVSLNARLIPAWSIVGAAWSTLITEAVVTLGCLTALWAIGAGTARAPRAMTVAS